jgi:RNA polymerase sigma-70 factor (ECF subfamily)
VVLGLLVRLLGRRSEAEEILQEAFLQVWMQADRFDPQRATPRGWILRIAHSRALDRLRNRGLSS